MTTLKKTLNRLNKNVSPLKIEFDISKILVWTKNLWEILCLQIIVRQKCNFSSRFKLELITTYYLEFIVKCSGHKTSWNLPKKTQISLNQMLNCDFLNFVFNRHILKSLFFFPLKNAHFQIISVLVLTKVSLQTSLERNPTNSSYI